MATNDNKKSNKKGKYANSKKRSATSKNYAAKHINPTNDMIRTNPITGKQSVSHKRKHKKRNNFKIDFEKLYNKISKKDVKWYWDIKKWSPIIIILFLITYAVGCNNGKNEQIAYFETIPPETIYVEVTEPIEVAAEETEPVRDEEAVALAILADTSASGKSREVKKILMWVAINRTEDRANGYGGTLLEEIARPKQWQGYNPEGMYLQETYDLALEVLEIWRSNGPRPLYNDMLWSVYNGDGTITVRNRFGNQKGRMEQTYG